MKIPTPSQRRGFYVVVLAGAIVVDIATPLAFADWLLEVALVWLSCLWAETMECATVAAAASLAIIVGFWSSPGLSLSHWIPAANRGAGIALIWAMVHVNVKRRAAERRQALATADLNALERLLPICAVCKGIRDNAGEWHNIEWYLSKQADARLTHTYCPKCASGYLDCEAEHRAP